VATIIHYNANTGGEGITGPIPKNGARRNTTETSQPTTS